MSLLKGDIELNVLSKVIAEIILAFSRQFLNLSNAKQVYAEIN